MSHLTLWDQKSLSYREYAEWQGRVIQRAYDLAKSGVPVREAVTRAIKEVDG